MRRVTPRSSQTVARESFSRKRRSWLISTSAERDEPQLVLQPFDRRQVEMVGRLVEQQNVGLGRQHARERSAPRLAAGKARGVFVAGETELFEQVARAMGVVAGREARLHIRERGGKARQVRFLRQISDGGAGLGETRAAIGFHRSGGDLQECGFARAVAADQADALAFADGKLGAFEQRRAAKGEVDVLQGEKRWRHARRLGRWRGQGKPWHAACEIQRSDEQNPDLDHETHNSWRDCRRFHRRCAGACAGHAAHRA